ncbi:MAG: Bacterial ABC transporter protein EcsB [Pelotomaculum sp. PtaU1.Bin035]|nr:MAG: Bacterial ABC transporter protein EcsB [Pelotomaculum sp. PtaU1.Bin035]
MISATQIFFRRVKSEWKFQYNVWKTAIDWTVGLYILIPAVLIGLDSYVLLWKNQYGWPEALPFYWLLPVIYLFAWSGDIRTFLEKGDQLFLLQRKRWLRRIIALGAGYTAMLDLLLSFLVFSLLAPLLFINYKLSAVRFALLLGFVFLFKTNTGMARQLFELRFQGWKKVIAMKIAFVLMSFIFVKGVIFLLGQPRLLLSACAVFLIALGFLTKMRLEVRGSFFDDVAREQRHRFRYASLLLSMSGISVKRTKSQKRRPLLLRSSNHLFRKRNAVNLLAELCIKSVLRNNRSLLFYAQMVAVSVLLVLSCPFWWKWIIWPGVAFLLASLAGLYWKEAVSSGFVQLFQWKPGDKSAAAGKSMFLLMLPGFLLISFVTGFQTFSWMGACLTLPAGIVLGYWITKLISIFV